MYSSRRLVMVFIPSSLRYPGCGRNGWTSKDLRMPPGHCTVPSAGTGTHRQVTRPPDIFLLNHGCRSPITAPAADFSSLGFGQVGIQLPEGATPALLHGRSSIQEGLTLQLARLIRGPLQGQQRLAARLLEGGGGEGLPRPVFAAGVTGEPALGIGELGDEHDLLRPLDLLEDPLAV